jgi:Cu-Zn family superoxide dismutase
MGNAYHCRLVFYPPFNLPPSWRASRSAREWPGTFFTRSSSGLPSHPLPLSPEEARRNSSEASERCTDECRQMTGRSVLGILRFFRQPGAFFFPWIRSTFGSLEVRFLLEGETGSNYPGVAMKKMALLLSLAAISFGVLQAQVPQKAKATGGQRAVAVLHSVGATQARGVVLFTQREGYVEISGEIVGLAPGLHGFHVHEFGDCSAADASSAGDHFNPTKMRHGDPNDPNRHAGDLGNLQADHQGRAVVSLKNNLLQLEGLHGIVGRSLIVHSDPDDFQTQPSGNSGSRLACGVIGLAHPNTLPQADLGAGKSSEISRPGVMGLRKRLFQR